MQELALAGAVRGKPHRIKITHDTAERPRDLVGRQFDAGPRTGCGSLI
jgi:hypothetical protein